MKKFILAAILMSILGLEEAKALDCTPGHGCTTLIQDTNAACTLTACLQTPLPTGTITSTVTVSGTFTGTLQFEQSADYGRTWVAILGYPQPSGAAASSTTSTGVWVFYPASRTNLRVRASAFANGSAITTIVYSSGGGSTGGGGSVAAYTLFGNNTASPAAPTYNSMDTLFGSCSAADEALTFSTTTHAFGCNTIASTPSLDQVLDPTADKTFDMGTYKLVMNWDDANSNNALFGSATPLNVNIESCGNGEVLCLRKLGRVAANVMSQDNGSGVSTLNVLSYTDKAAGSARGYDAYITDGGTENIGSLDGFGLSVDHESTGTLNTATGFLLNYVSAGGSEGRAQTVRMINVGSPSNGSKIYENAGIYVDDQTGSAIRTSYAVKTVTGFNDFGDRVTITPNVASIQIPSALGAGHLDDLLNGGTFTGGTDADYQIQITSTGTPDTFTWTVGSGACVGGAAGVAITGAAQSLNCGVTITFGATTGHTLLDIWNFTAYTPTGLVVKDSTNYAIKTGLGLVSLGDRLQLGTIHYANRGAVVPGQMFYCDDCDPSTVSGIANECTSAGAKTGAVATGTNAKWACMSVN